MPREPFPRPGERLVDSERPPENPPQRRISVFGSVGYGPGHPSRWAGTGRGGARLTVENDVVIIRPIWFERNIFRRPVVRIPLAEITSARTMTFGIWFVVHDDPGLDGTRFTPFGGALSALNPLVGLLEARGIPVDTMPVSSRVSTGIENWAVAMRPGLIWRDRGLLGVVESVAAMAVVFTVFALQGTPRFFMALLVLVAALTILGWIVGSRRRTKALAAGGVKRRR